ncbi:MAG: S8 family peptidase [Bacillota bacterium]
MKKLQLLVVLLTALLITITGCDGNLPPTTNTDEEEPVIEEKIPEYNQGELLAVVENNQGQNSLTPAEQRTSLLQNASRHKNILAKTNMEAENLYTGSDQRIKISTELAGRLANNIGHTYSISFDTSDYSDINQAQEKVRDTLEAAGEEVKFVIPNYKIHLPEHTALNKKLNPSVHSEQDWHYQVINAPDAWEKEQGTTDLKIAVMDSGIDYEHQDLKNLVAEELGKNFTTEDSNDFTDRNGHGTHVAGTIASYGNVSGVMHQASLIPIKVLNEEGSGNMDSLIEGIIHAAEVEADVLNISLSGLINKDEPDGRELITYLDDLFQTIRKDSGVLPVTAAGNGGEEIDGVDENMDYLYYPAGLTNTLTVGALQAPPDTRSRADFSNYGEELDVMAPGVSIFSTFASDYYQDPENGYQEELIQEIDGYNYAYLQGTSMAAPHVSGMAGLIRAYNPEISATDLESLIRESTHELGNDNQYGKGVIDCYRGVGGRITEPYF